MDDVDRRIIAELQGGLSLSTTPWTDAADALGMNAQELIDRLERMKNAGLLRGTRAILDQRKLGLEGNIMVAWHVDENRIEEVGNLFAARSEVTHCMLRSTAPGWPYNLYTMVHAGTLDEARAVVEEMADASGIVEYESLETLRELKKTPPRYV